MFSFIKKLAKSFFRLFKKEKKLQKSKIIADKISTTLSFFTPKKEQPSTQKSDFLKELSLLILKEFGFARYVNFALGFARLLR